MVGHFQEFEDEYLEMMYEFHEAEPGGMAVSYTHLTLPTICSV